MKFLLPFELTNNNEGRKKSWYKPDKQRREFELALLALGLKRTPFSVPVFVTVVRILGSDQKLWDSSSILRGNYKELEDALVAAGWFHDDNPKWIVGTYGKQDATRRSQGPAVELIIRQEVAIERARKLPGRVRASR